MSANSDVCKIVHSVDEHILDHDTPENFIQSLDSFFQDVIGGTSFTGASPEARSTYYYHYRMLRDFLTSLKPYA